MVTQLPQQSGGGKERKWKRWKDGAGEGQRAVGAAQNRDPKQMTT